MSRNRVLHPREGWNYVSVPLSNSSITIKTAEARILSFEELAPSLIGKLSHYRKKAPHHKKVEHLITEIFSVPTDSLVELNVRALDTVCRYLGIRFDYVVASKLNLPLPEIEHPGGWAPAISRCLLATEYVNPVGGCSIFRQSDFDEVGVMLKFLDFTNFVYPTPPYRFEVGLSILDVMMWNEPAAIRDAIASHTNIIDSRDYSGMPLSTQ